MILKKKKQNKKPQNIAWSKPGIFKSQATNTFSDKELDTFPQDRNRMKTRPLTSSS